MIRGRMHLRFSLGLALVSLLCLARSTFAERITIGTKEFSLNFQEGNDHRLYQQPIGAEQAGWEPKRDDEFYPQAGGGYGLEAPLVISSSCGTTSTALLCEGVTRTNK